MINLNTLFLFTLLLGPITILAKISDLRLCANVDCTELISYAKTLITYNSPEKGLLSFRPNTDVKIYSKSAGDRAELWGAEINNQRGYVNKNMVREYKVLVGKLIFLRPTEQINQLTEPLSPTESKIITNEKSIIKEAPSENLGEKTEFTTEAITPSFEVFDGTTIYIPSSGSETTPTPISNEQTEPLKTPEYIKTTPQPTESGNANVKENTRESLLENPKISVNEDKINVAEPISEPGNVINKKTEENKSEEVDNDEEDDEEDYEDDEDGEFIEVDDDDENIPDLSTEKLKREKRDEPTPKKTIDDIKISSTPESTYKPVENVNPTIKNPEPVSETHESSTMAPQVQKSEDIVDVKNSSSEELNTADSLLKPIENADPTIKNPELVPETHDSSTIAPQVQKDENKVDVKNSSSEKLHTAEPLLKPIENADHMIKNPESFPSIVENSGSPLPGTPLGSIHSGDSANIAQQNVEPMVQYLKVENVEPENALPSDETIHAVNPVNSENGDPNAPKIVVNVENIEEATKKQDENLIIPNTNAKENILTSEDVLNPVKVENDIPNVPKIVDNFELVKKMEEVPITQEANPNIPNFNVDNSEYLKTPEPDVESTLKGERGVNERGEKLEHVPSVEKPVDSQVNQVPENINTLPNTFEFNSVTTESSVPDIPPPPGIEPESFTENPQTIDIPPPYMSPESTTESDMTEPPVTQPLTDVHATENAENLLETSTDKSGIFSNIVSWMSGSETQQEATQVDEKKLLEDAIRLNEIAETEEKIRSDIQRDETKPYQQPELSEKHTHEKPFDKYLQNGIPTHSHDADSCLSSENPSECLKAFNIEQKTEDTMDDIWLLFDLSDNGINVLLYLTLTAVTVLIFSLGHYYIEKRRIDSTLVSNINELEKKLLVTSKESQLLQDELNTTKEKLTTIEDTSFGSDEMVQLLRQELEEAKTTRNELEEQISNLERELENATEAGLELNKMLAEFLSSQTGSDNIMQHVEHLQKQLFEQQATLSSKNTENELLQTELSVSNGKVEQLQAELDKMVVNLLSVQEAKSKIEAELEEQNKLLTEEYENKIKSVAKELDSLKEDNIKLKRKLEEVKRALDLKSNEYQVLKDSMEEVKSINTNKESLAALLDVSKVKAEVQQLRDERHKLTTKLSKEQESKTIAEKQIQVIMQELTILRDKLQDADKEKAEAVTRLDVLSSYFKEREAQLQRELQQHESQWLASQGETSSTVERIRHIQEELMSCRQQNELLKKEILDQEVELKSQISVLEKRAHESWLLARQAERRLDDSRQEASQLRNKLTLVEREHLSNTLDDSKLHNSQYPQPNGDIGVSPLHSIDNPGSPPLPLFRDHMTTSPPLPGLLPPFPPPGLPMPPPPGPPGAPFLPPPPGGGGFMPVPVPPPSGMYPGDHRPPPLGRMSSPAAAKRIPRYSPYDYDGVEEWDGMDDDSPPPSPGGHGYPRPHRRSPPPPPRTYSPYARDYRQRPMPQHAPPARTHKVSSSGSGNSNDSMDASGRHHSRV